MGFKSQESGIAASIYLALYFFYMTLSIYIVSKKGFKHIYTLLLFFGIIRFASQICGVVFAVLGIEHWQWLIAYLVLGAEGYFALIYASFRFICNAQKKACGRSWVLSSGPKFKTKVMQKLFGKWIRLFHHALLPANILVIAGGSLLAGIDTSQYEQSHDKILISKVLRTVGQSIFLTLTILTIYFNAYVFIKSRIRNHITISIFLASPFLLVRGIFGVLSIYLPAMNYFQLSNYSESGFSSKLVVYEYVLATTMEFVSAVFLLSNYFFHDDRNVIYETDEAVFLQQKNNEAC